MSNVPAPEFVKDTKRLLMDIRRKHNSQDAHKAIPVKWQEFREQYQNYAQDCPITYSVIRAGDDQGFEYMCGLEIESFDKGPADVGRIILQEQNYAVFYHQGALAELGRTWELIFTQWLPKNNLKSAYAPSFERYDHTFKASANQYKLAIWVPILNQ
jgi:AraC family transcriptional regulator